MQLDFYFKNQGTVRIYNNQPVNSYRVSCGTRIQVFASAMNPDTDGWWIPGGYVADVFNGLFRVSKSSPSYPVHLPPNVFLKVLNGVAFYRGLLAAWTPLDPSTVSQDAYFPYTFPHTMVISDPTPVVPPSTPTAWTPVTGV